MTILPKFVLYFYLNAHVENSRIVTSAVYIIFHVRNTGAENSLSDNSAVLAF